MWVLLWVFFAVPGLWLYFALPQLLLSLPRLFESPAEPLALWFALAVARGLRLEQREAE